MARERVSSLYVATGGEAEGPAKPAETGIVTAFVPDPWGQPSADNAMRGTSSPEGVAADKNGVVYASGVTPAGIAKYTIQHNVPHGNSQGRGPGSPGGPPVGSPEPTVPPPAGQ